MWWDFDHFLSLNSWLVIVIMSSTEPTPEEEAAARAKEGIFPERYKHA
jgi:hypothetical protein